MTTDFSFKLTYLMTISLVLSSIPNMLSMIRLPIYNWAALTCFRILSRSFSGVVRFHNEQFRPKSDGICVANHTTPIDVVVLSCDRSYALVTKLKIASGPNFALFWLDLVKIGLLAGAALERVPRVPVNPWISRTSAGEPVDF